MWGWGGGCVLSPVIKSESFTEPVHLDCELPKCFLVPHPRIGGTGWLEWAVVRDFPSPTWKTRACWSRVFLFPHAS